MRIIIDVEIYESQYHNTEGGARMTLDAPIDLALDADLGVIVRLLLQQAHDDYIERKAGQEAE